MNSLAKDQSLASSCRSGTESEYHTRLMLASALMTQRTSIPILDSIGRLVAILVGQPSDPQWPHLHAQGAAALERLRSHCFIPKCWRKPHRRGAFVALQCGVSHGGGQPAPKNLENHPENEKVLNELNNMPFFQRIAGFASGMCCPAAVVAVI